MKKFLLFLVAAIFIVAILDYCGNQNENEHPEKFMRAFTFEQSSVTETKLNDSLSKNFPQTFLFCAVTEDLGLIAFNSLPNYFNSHDTLLSKFPHGNMTLIEKSGQTYGIIPKHLFSDNVDLVYLLSKNGFNPTINKDLITVRLKNSLQKVLKSDLLSKLESEKIDSAPCIIRTLNMYPNDTAIYQYEIKGKVHYLTEEEKSFFLINARNSTGGKPYEICGDGMFVVRVPDNLFSKIPGMSGGSVVINVENKEYFFGMNVSRIYQGVTNGKDTTFVTLMSIQPVLDSDIY